MNLGTRTSVPQPPRGFPCPEDLGQVSHEQLRQKNNEFYVLINDIIYLDKLSHVLIH